MSILNQFAEFLEKQDVLSKLTESEKLHNYGYSEIHVIACIGELKEPNVTEIARTMKMTRGAVSKITKKLIAQNILEPYGIAGNRQKVFFSLTETGRSLYAEHARRHQLWMERDSRFLQQFSGEQLDEISRFMTKYNRYLEMQINERGGT